MGWGGGGPKGKRKGAGTALYACLGKEVGPVKTEIPDGEVNYSRRHINLSNMMGAMIG